MSDENPLVLVSNRGPATFERDTDGNARRPRLPRCHWIVAAPASKPASWSSLRNATTASSTVSDVRFFTVPGAEDRTSRPAMPSFA